MNPKFSPSQLFQAMDKIFSEPTNTRLDKTFLSICKVSGLITFSGAVLQTLTKPAGAELQNLAYGALAASAFIFFMSFCVLGIRTAGRRKGKTGFLSQLWLMLSRVTLFVFVPAIILTLILIVWAIATNQPGLLTIISYCKTINSML